ncbi:MAG: hypothetical protein Q8R18_06605 [bacterium]|nr:hypothetical protein [bacterium]
MYLEDIFQEKGNLELKRKAMGNIRAEKNIDAYPFIEKELSGSLRHNAFITLASLDLNRTLPYLREELKKVPDKYLWLGHADYRASPLILTMEVILGEQDDKGMLQESIDRFKPLSEKERAFFAYTLQCLFYLYPEVEKNILL